MCVCLIVVFALIDTFDLILLCNDKVNQKYQFKWYAKKCNFSKLRVHTTLQKWSNTQPFHYLFKAQITIFPHTPLYKCTILCQTLSQIFTSKFLSCYDDDQMSTFWTCLHFLKLKEEFPTSKANSLNFSRSGMGKMKFLNFSEIHNSMGTLWTTKLAYVLVHRLSSCL